MQTCNAQHTIYADKDVTISFTHACPPISCLDQELMNQESRIHESVADLQTGRQLQLCVWSMHQQVLRLITSDDLLLWLQHKLQYFTYGSVITLDSCATRHVIIQIQLRILRPTVSQQSYSIVQGFQVEQTITKKPV